MSSSLITFCAITICVCLPRHSFQRRRVRKAEWLGNDNRKTMIKIKTIGQILPFKSGTALPSPSPAPGWAPCLNIVFDYAKRLYIRIKKMCICTPRSMNLQLFKMNTESQPSKKAYLNLCV